ncbi:MAG TPA: hypothetical protein VI039_01260 [Solirubrobacterales bacterium]
MTPSFNLTPERHESPDVQRVVAALLAFVMAQMEAEEAAAEKQPEDGDDD